MGATPTQRGRTPPRNDAAPLAGGACVNGQNLHQHDTRSGPGRTLALRPKDAAKALCIGQRKLWELTKAGAIPHTRIGRCIVYPVDALRAWLAERAAKGVRP